MSLLNTSPPPPPSPSLSPLLILELLPSLATVRKGDKVSEVKKITIVSLALSYFYSI
jgi:hypothetical protein